ncbi:MAG: sigma-70 family RNA polymerase sigma factor [Clostridia bacterium]|nr:MAG: sigma-70 family RNA polymerase sigma factor [Clostridia bacterium]
MAKDDFQDIRIYLAGQADVNDERWRSFYRYCHNTVTALIWRYDPGGRLKGLEVEDLVQDVLAIVTARAESLDPWRSFGNYVYGVARNLVLYHRFRAGKKEPQTRLPPGDNNGAWSHPAETRPSHLPGGEMDDREELEDIFQAIAALQPEDARAIYLRVVAGKGYREVAASLGISEGAAKKRVARAIAHIRHTLLPYHPELSRLV